MSPKPKASWHVVFLTYPCPTCGAAPGEECLTAGGARSQLPHVDRARLGDRCPKCGAIVDADHEPGQLCARCELVRALETERATQYKRRDP
jgi:ribosomal protein S27AE